MTTHTPAPWKVIKDVKRLPNSKEVQTHDGAVIAEVFTDIAESAANARLIAAAPELLEALKGLMKEAVKLAESQPDNAPIWAWIDDASDAIAKAEGN